MSRNWIRRALLRLAKPVRGYVFKLTEVSPRLGDEVAALGFPFGLPLTLTRDARRDRPHRRDRGGRRRRVAPLRRA